MKKTILSTVAALLLGCVGALAALSSSASAATTIATPIGGECYRGGSSLVLKWSSNDLFKPSYSYVSYGTSTITAPKYPTSSNIAGGTKVTSTSLGWTLPAVTRADYVVYIASMSGLNTPYSQATSQPFSVDASRPSKPILSKSSVTATSVHLHWTAASDAGCMPLTGYSVVRDGAVIAKTTSTSFIDSNRKPGVTYRYQIVAYDAFASTASSLLSVTTPKPVAPAKPTGLVPLAPILSLVPQQETPGLPATPPSSKLSHPTVLPANDTGLAVWSPEPRASTRQFSAVSRQGSPGAPVSWLVAITCGLVAVVLLVPVATSTPAAQPQLARHSRRVQPTGSVGKSPRHRAKASMRRQARRKHRRK